MDLAHSLGFPHYELMLRSMSSSQFSELLAFLRLKRKRKETQEASLNEIRVAEFLRSKMRKQQEAQANG